VKMLQIELSDQQFDALKGLSEERGKSISEVVSFAIGQYLSIQSEIDIDKILKEIRSVAGIWSNRDDIGSTDEYVREIRNGTSKRMKRMGIWKDDESD